MLPNVNKDFFGKPPRPFFNST